MPVQKKTSIYFAIELSLREISFVVYMHAVMTQSIDQLIASLLSTPC